MKRGVLVTAVLISLLLASCRQSDRFQIEGRIVEADNKWLYFEHKGLADPVPLDSILLNEEGEFRFRSELLGNPEFYQLRLDDQLIMVTPDSGEIIRLEADASDLWQTLSIEGSYSSLQIREVERLTRLAAEALKSYQRESFENRPGAEGSIERLDSTLLSYKSAMSNIIIGNPSSAAAYYALFQKLEGYPVFDPYDRGDYAMYGAVATSWHSRYPDSERSKHLYEFTMNALRVRRSDEKRREWLEDLPKRAAIGSGLPDIVLKGVRGEEKSLSSLVGKVVLLDFVIYNADFSPLHNIALKNLHDRYAERGFEIYQISLDPDEHFWKVSAGNLPWIGVRDPKSINSKLLSLWNVQELPTGFIIDRKGDIVVRVTDYGDLPEKLKGLL